MKVKTPSVKEHTNRRKKVKRVRKHYRKVLRMLARDLQKVLQQLEEVQDG